MLGFRFLTQTPPPDLAFANAQPPRRFRALGLHSPFSDFTHCRPDTRLENCPYYMGHPNWPVNGSKQVGRLASTLHVKRTSWQPLKPIQHVMAGHMHDWHIT